MLAIDVLNAKQSNFQIHWKAAEAVAVAVTTATEKSPTNNY